VIDRIGVSGHWLEGKRSESERNRGVKAAHESPPLKKSPSENMAQV